MHDSGGPVTSGRLCVLHVCTGNVCRSPMAEGLMRQGLVDRLGPAAERVTVRSAGTGSLRGNPMEPFAVSAIEPYGVGPADFQARDLTAALVSEADLILTATRRHRAAVVVLDPKAASRTFTVREFDRLCELVDPVALPTDVVERGRALVRAAAAQRGMVFVDPADADVEDPYRGPESAFASCAQLLHGALQRPLDLLAGGR